ncbi:MAG: TIM barrel protein [Desulfurococcaceae archaeon]
MPRFRFGPAGKPISMKSKDIVKAPSFLREMGLNAMEYEAVRGVNIKEEKAREFGSEALLNDVKLSLHAPYYINLASAKKSVVEASVKRLMESVQASFWMGSYIVVFHAGYYSDAPSKREALEWVIKNLAEVIEFRDSIGANNVLLGVETTGKKTQIGDISEAINISQKLKGVVPVIDWAHIYARYQGKFIVSEDDVIRIVNDLEKELGSYVLKPLHTHFSKIEYGKGGERRHVVLSEEGYGPDFKIVCRALYSAGVEAVFISESPVLEQDALIMKSICREICGDKCVAD